jgi:hypothetical protein
MANGQVVLVTTERLGGGPPMRTVYYIAEDDPAKAEAIIAKIMAPNERVEAYGPLPEPARHVCDRYGIDREARGR